MNGLIIRLIIKFDLDIWKCYNNTFVVVDRIFSSVFFFIKTPICVDCRQFIQHYVRVQWISIKECWCGHTASRSTEQTYCYSCFWTRLAYDILILVSVECSCTAQHLMYVRWLSYIASTWWFTIAYVRNKLWLIGYHIHRVPVTKAWGEFCSS